jgi:DNA polymerase III subunit delta'
MDFIGNKKTISFLQKSLKSGLLNHAYIFSGPDQVGKFTLAKMFALSAISGTEMSLDTNDFNKDALLDLIVVAPEVVEKNGISKQRDISIESIRDVKQSLSLFPYHGKYKIMIVDDAHKLNISAQNALLKILEEPNPTTIIILVTHEIDRILPTVQSRSQIINFSLANDEQMQKIFSKDIISLSAGRPGLAQFMLENEDERIFRSEAINDFNKVISGSINEKFALAEEFSKDIIKTLKMLDIWIWEMRKNAFSSDEIKRKDIYASMEKIQKNMETLKRTNANARLVLETLFMDI